MKNILLLGCVLAGCQKPAIVAKPAVLQTDEQKLGYVIGVDIGDRLKRQPHKIDFQAVLRGIEETYLNQAMTLGKDSILALQTRFQKRSDAYESGMQSRRQGGLDFMEKNGKEKGVITLPNGLQYQVLSGSPGGEHPSDSAIVACHLKGSLLDGTVLEDSRQEGVARKMEMSEAIEGIKAALRLMSPGEKVKAWIPSPLAFGRERKGERIPEYATLVYEIELLEILPPARLAKSGLVSVR